MPNIAVEQVLIFVVGDLVCAVPAGVTREVLSPVAATRLPGVSDVVDGLVNIRGTLLTVVDGHRLLRRPADPDHEGAIIVLNVFDRSCGLRVGRLVDLVVIPADAIDGRDTLPGVDPRIVKAVGRHQDDPFVLLDLEELLRPVMGT
jgi:purine-binding chemotaxis protein CheW